jgi:hypothetical protein
MQRDKNESLGHAGRGRATACFGKQLDETVDHHIPDAADLARRNTFLEQILVAVGRTV